MEGWIDQHRLEGCLVVEGAFNERLQQFYGPGVEGEGRGEWLKVEK